MKLAALFFLSFTVCLRAAILTDAWSLNINDHTSVQRTYKQGESIDMRIILRNGLAPLDLTGATARFYWFTNTTANVWWTNSVAISAPKAGLVQSTWTPAMDTGAPMYYYWIGVWQAGSTSPLWRVTGNIRMLPSPGFTPNALPMPVRTLDFAAIAITNAPWVTAADWRSGSNALATAVQAHSDRTDNPHVVTTAQIGAATTGDLAFAYSPANEPTRILSPTNATEWIDGAGTKWLVEQVQVVSDDTNRLVVISAEDTIIYSEDTGVTTSEGSVFVRNVDGYGFWECDSWRVFFGDGAWRIRSPGGIIKVAQAPVWPSGPEGLWSPNGYFPDASMFDAVLEYGVVTNTVTVTNAFPLGSTVLDAPSITNIVRSITPTNYIAGFVLPIPGTNVLYALSVNSNRTLSVWEVIP